MRNVLLLSLLVTIYALPVSAGIYIGTDATPPQSYQSDVNYPTNITVSNNTAGQRNCRLYTDGKGPIPPLTCSANVNATPAVAPITSTKTLTPAAKTSAPTNIVFVPTKNDQAAKQQPLAHIEESPKPAPTPVVKPVTAPTLVVKPVTAPTPVVKPVCTSTPVVKPKPAPTPVVKPVSTPTPVVKPVTAPTPMVKPVSTPTPAVKPVAVSTPVVKPMSAPTPEVKPVFTTTVMPGSLKANIERIVAQSHWGTVVWNLPIDYNWQGTMTITAPDVQDALSQLLVHYPVQATFYDQNHIVSIDARRAI